MVLLFNSSTSQLFFPCAKLLQGDQKEEKKSYLMIWAIRLLLPTLKVQQQGLTFTALLAPLFKAQLKAKNLKIILKNSVLAIQGPSNQY